MVPLNIPIPLGFFQGVNQAVGKMHELEFPTGLFSTWRRLMVKGQFIQLEKASEVV